MRLFGLTICFALLCSRLLLAQAEFVPNMGQWPAEVKFRSAMGSATLWAQDDAFTYLFVDEEYLDQMHPGGDGPKKKVPFKAHAYRMHFVDALTPQIEGRKKQEHYYNYYLSNDPAQWASKVPVYHLTYYHELYAHVDMQLYSTSTSLKYDFILHPGADASQLHLNYEGLDKIELVNGHLMLHTSVNVVKETAPFAYQVINGKMVEVPCRYVLQGEDVRFEIGEYRHDLDLIIDPEIAFASLIGSQANNFGFTACDDHFENLIAGAAVFQSNFPTTVGAYDDTFNGPTGPQFTIAGFDVGLTKFSPDGTQLLYCTYFGGGSQDAPHSIVANSSNQFIVMGMTGSPNLPVTPGAYQTTFGGGPSVNTSDFFSGTAMGQGVDLYVAMFNTDGSLAGSTFLGGPNTDGLNLGNQLFYNYGDVFRGEVNVDSQDNIFVSAVTNGNFPVTANAIQPTYGGGTTDGVLVKLNPQLTNVFYSSYIGGSDADACYAVQFAQSGAILVGGGTRSSDFPWAIGGNDNSWNGGVDGFVLTISPGTLNVTSGSFVGTSDYDQVYFVQADNTGNVYVLGQTAGTMPISGGCYGQADSGLFIRKFDATLATMLWNTTIGTSSGEVDISPGAFLVSDCNYIYFSGWGGEVNSGNCMAYGCHALSSTTFGLPTTPDAFQGATDGSDFYLGVLTPDAAALSYATFFGGALSPEHVDGGTSRFDKDGSVYQAVCAGCQGNSDFPTTPGAYASNNPSGRCNLGVFRFNLGQAVANLQVNTPNPLCVNAPVSFNNLSQNASAFEWSFGDGATSNSPNPTHAYATEGTYIITLIAGNAQAECSIPDTARIELTILPGVNPTLDPVGILCPGNSVTLNAQGSAAAYWINNPTLNTADVFHPIASPTVTTTYFFIDSNECESDTLAVQIPVAVVNTSISENDSICTGQSVMLQASGGTQYVWSPTTYLNNSSSPSPVSTPTESITYTVTIITADGCEATEQVYINVVFNPPGGNVYDPVNMCEGETTILHADAASSYQWSPQEYVTSEWAQNTVAFPPDTMTFSVQLTNACGSGVDYVTVNVIFPTVEAFGGGTVCKGGSVDGYASGGVDYMWRPPVYCSYPDSSYTRLSPLESRWMYVDIRDENGCLAHDSVWVNILPLPEVDAGPDQYFDFPGAVQLFGDNHGWPFSWEWEETITCTDCLYPVVAPDQEKYFVISVIDNQGCRNADSVLVVPYFPIWVPNTITPNNDGINDVFKAVGEHITGFHLVIYDRWGMKVFESNDIDKVWDGGINGYYVQNDTYVWVIEFDSRERRTHLEGHVNVLR